MSRFEEDLERETGLGEFLDNELYPQISTQHRRVSAPDDQKAGHDSEITFEWLSEEVTVDEKAQNSDRWLNNAYPTFVMEIFGESWFENGKPKGNPGWYINDDIETEYYTLVWLPDVSLFGYERIPGDYPVFLYEPSDEVGWGVNEISKGVFQNTETRIKQPDPVDPQRKQLRFTPTETAIRTFESHVESIPQKLKNFIKTGDGSNIKPKEWYYAPEHIREAKIVVVKKSKIENVLDEVGLTKEVLEKKGYQAIRNGKVPVDTDKAKHVVRSSGNHSGTDDNEQPVILVVNYSTYHEIADATYHYKNGSWSSGKQLF